MAWYILGIFGLGALLSVVILLASKNGSKSAKLEALKAEIRKQAEEQARANRINNFANGLSGDDARKLLHDVANEQSKRVQ